MTADNNLRILERRYGHVVANFGTESRYAVTIREVIGLIKNGSTVKEAFDEVDKIVEEENRKKSTLQPQSP